MGQCVQLSATWYFFAGCRSLVGGCFVFAVHPFDTWFIRHMVYLTHGLFDTWFI